MGGQLNANSDLCLFLFFLDKIQHKSSAKKWFDEYLFRVLIA